MKNHIILFSRWNTSKCRGGVSFRILMALFTLLLIGASLFFLLENQKLSSKTDHRKAIELSDYGFQQFMVDLLDRLNKGEAVRGIDKKEYDGGWYKVTVASEQQDSVLSLSIASEGLCGKQTVVKEEKVTLHRSVNGSDTVWIPISNEY